MGIRIKDYAIIYMVGDIDRTERFYRDMLGIELERQSADDGPDWLYARLHDGLEILFFQGEATVGQTPVLVLGLQEGHIDTVVEELADKGVEIATPVAEAPGGWSADIFDPDGHLLSFFQSDTLPRR